MTWVKEALADWCASYVAAFEAKDAAGIGGHWSFPALILTGERRLVFDCADKFNANTEMLLRFYEAQGVTRVRRRVVSAMNMTDQAASMLVSDEMLNSEGVVIAAWEAAYTLQHIDGEYRAVMAAADGEVAAWAARGTPLGRV